MEEPRASIPLDYWFLFFAFYIYHIRHRGTADSERNLNTKRAKRSLFFACIVSFKRHYFFMLKVVLHIDYA